MNLNIFKGGSLRTRVILFTLAIFLAGIWSLALYASRLLRQDLQGLLSDQQFSTVSYIAAEVNHELGDRLRALETVAASISPAMLANAPALQAHLEQSPILLAMFNGGALASRLDGTAVADVPLAAGRIGVNYMDTDVMAAALKEGKATIGRPIMGKKLLAPIVPMAVPIHDAQGQVIGALNGVTNLGLPNFLDQLTESRYGKTGGYVLVAPQHQLIVTATDKRLVMTAISGHRNEPLIDRFIQGYEGSGVLVNPVGVEVLASAKGVPVAGWYAAVALPTAEAFAPLDAMQQRMLLATIFLSLLAGGLTWWVTVEGWKRLTQQEQKFRTLLELLPDPLVIADGKGLITLVNRQVVALLGYEPQELVGQPVEMLLPQRYHGGHVALRQGYTQASQVHEMGKDRLLWAVTKQGREIPVNVSLSPIHTEQGLMVAAAIRDITARRADEAKIRRLTELYAALNQCSQAIVRCTSEDELFPQICRAVVQFGGMKMAWVGLLDEANQLVKPVACYGTGTEYLEGIQISVNADEPSGRGTTGMVFRENRPVWIQDFQNDPRIAPWHERGARAGWRATAALPLLRQDKVIGTFSLYVDEVNAFDEAVRNLLVELATNINYAMDIYSLQAERKRAEEELRIAATAFESQEGMMITDANSVILRVNRAFTEITGYTAEEAVGQTPRLFQSGRHNKDFYRTMWESIHRTGGWQGEIWDRRKSGEIYPKWLTITAVKSDDGTVTHYVGTHIDITARKVAEDEIMHLAFYDPLTQLPNRRLLLDRLQQALASSARSGRNGALLFIDLDNFKTLNDTLGHDKGDLLLQQVAQRLATCVSEGDTVARLGGDEFVVMLEGLSEQPEEAATQTETVGEKILATLNQPYLLAGYENRSTPSIGVTLFSGQTSIEELLKQADLAMYQSKTAGRNTLRFFDPEMQAIVANRAAQEVELREAVRQQQFILYYQPQVVGDGRLTGAEALVRWQHPQRGMVSPAEFIPLAEETGLILPLGLWVLETACSQLAKWAAQSNTAHLSLAVNVSANQLQQADFVDQVLAVLGRTGANPKKLKLELTESLLVSDVENIIAKMGALKAHGVGFSLDDFGTGYSSLSYLKRLPLDQLKIDQGFVRDILSDPNDAAIAKMVIALAGSMGLTVIAEGVELEAQRDFLARLGCHAYQGYLFSRPLPLDAFEEFVKRV